MHRAVGKGRAEDRTRCMQRLTLFFRCRSTSFAIHKNVSSSFLLEPKQDRDQEDPSLAATSTVAKPTGKDKFSWREAEAGREEPLSALFFLLHLDAANRLRQRYYAKETRRAFGEPLSLPLSLSVLAWIGGSRSVNGFVFMCGGRWAVACWLCLLAKGRRAKLIVGGPSPPFFWNDVWTVLYCLVQLPYIALNWHKIE